MPHLSVSWAHHPQAQITEQRRDLNTLVSRAPLTQIRAGNAQPYLSPDSTSPPVSSSRSDVPSDQHIRQRPTVENDSRMVHKKSSVFGIGRGKNWPSNPTVAPGLAYKGPPVSSAVAESTEENGLEELITTRIDWAEANFPSYLNSEQSSPDVDWNVWGNTPSAERDTTYATFSPLPRRFGV